MKVEKAIIKLLAVRDLTLGSCSVLLVPLLRLVFFSPELVEEGNCPVASYLSR